MKNLQSCLLRHVEQQSITHPQSRHLSHSNMSADPRLRARQQQEQPTPTAVPPPPPPTERDSMGMDGSSDAHAEQNMVPDDGFKLKFCTVCASNQNRYDNR
jgi:hypothetical protein